MQGWVFAVPAFLRKERPKIFAADDPVPGALNAVFNLRVDNRRVEQAEAHLASVLSPLG